MQGQFSEKALALFSQLAAQEIGVNFSEGDSYDFARCVRPDGSTYGTSGRCRKGTETAPASGKGDSGGRKVTRNRLKAAVPGMLEAARKQHGRLQEDVKAAKTAQGKAVSALNTQLKSVWLKAAKDYRSRISDIQDEIRRNGSTPELQASLKMWNKKLSDVTARAQGNNQG